MNTQTHVIMGAALFGRPLPRLAIAGALGGIVPDAPMFAIVIGLRMLGYGLDDIFGRLYWEHWWQVANAIGHNIPLWGVTALVAYAASRNKDDIAAFFAALSASALLHSLIDLACHRDDAHMHFWPLTEWRFRSPVSYWDSAHYGVQFSLFEAALGLVLVLVLWRRCARWHLRLPLALALVAYAAVPAFFILG
jgi:membrane-bound metal-dependent hydrolase YbcI (DUF457 family)